MVSAAEATDGDGTGMSTACLLSSDSQVENKKRFAQRGDASRFGEEMGRRIEGAVRVQFAGRTLGARFVVDEQVITVEHAMLGTRSTHLRSEPADAVAWILLTKLAFENDEREPERD